MKQTRLNLADSPNLLDLTLERAGGFTYFVLPFICAFLSGSFPFDV